MEFRDVLKASAVAGTVSGIPSTVYGLLFTQDPLEPTLAAGSLLLPYEDSRTKLIAAAVPVHTALSICWTIALSALLPRRRPMLWGAAFGAAIAALDLGFGGRVYPRIRQLPIAPQVLDHVVFGAVAGKRLRG